MKYKSTIGHKIQHITRTRIYVKEILSLAELENELGITQEVIRLWILKGKLASRRIPAPRSFQWKYGVLSSDLDAFIEQYNAAHMCKNHPDKPIAVRGLCNDCLEKAAFKRLMAPAKLKPKRRMMRRRKPKTSAELRAALLLRRAARLKQEKAMAISTEFTIFQAHKDKMLSRIHKSQQFVRKDKSDLMAAWDCAHDALTAVADAARGLGENDFAKEAETVADAFESRVTALSNIARSKPAAPAAT